MTRPEDRFTERLHDCPTCGHPHEREDGTYMRCPICVSDCWITTPD